MAFDYILTMATVLCNNDNCVMQQWHKNIITLLFCTFYAGYGILIIFIILCDLHASIVIRSIPGHL